MRATQNQTRTVRYTVDGNHAPAVVSAGGVGGAADWRCRARSRRPQGMGLRHAGDQDRHEFCRANEDCTCPPARRVAGGSTPDPSLSPRSKKRSMTALANSRREWRVVGVGVDPTMFRWFNRRGESGFRQRRDSERKQPERGAGKRRSKQTRYR
ncbi:hypothetical protein VUR80DRAFT_3066 [Thermomyces stellatus]